MWAAWPQNSLNVLLPRIDLVKPPLNKRRKQTKWMNWLMANKQEVEVVPVVVVAVVVDGDERKGCRCWPKQEWHYWQKSEPTDRKKYRPLESWRGK